MLRFNCFYGQCLSLCILLNLVACSDSLTDSQTEKMHTVAFDLESSDVGDGKSDGLTDRFDSEWLMSDLFFLNTGELTSSQLQIFFENTPYGIRSWLADFKVNGTPISKIIIKQAHKKGINPILLLTRMQVEQSLVSRTEAPPKRITDAALGCGCYDGERCEPRFKGIENQLSCAGDTLRNLFERSRDGSGQWMAGKSRQTLDPLWIRPTNHATAAMYAYTPWVLKGRGGNWLAWNVTRKFTRFMKENGLIQAFDQNDLVSAEFSENLDEDWSMEALSKCLYNSERAFIGDSCGCQRDCDFYVGRQKGFCHPAGFCSLPCEGGCPDILDRAQTFCIEDSQAQEEKGICVAKSAEQNGHCADLPQTVDDLRERYIGSSSARPSSAEVCAPY